MTFSRLLGLRSLQGLLVAALFPLVALGTPAAGRYPGRTFGFSEGLTHTSVMSLVQGTDGLIYVGTEGGLFRFDGRRFEALDLPIDHQFITVLLPGADGRLWVGTRNGLGWFDPFWRFHAEGGPLAQRIHYLGFDAQGKLWVHAGEQLLVWSEGSFTSVPDHPAATDLVSVFADPSDSGVRILGKRGLWRLDASNKRWLLERLPLAESGDAPLAFGVDGDGFLWLRTRSTFWRKASGKSLWVRLGAAFAGAVPDHLSITRDREGWLWINTASGLLRCKGLVSRAIDTGPRGYIPVTGMLDRDHSPWIASLGVTQVMGQGLWTLHDVEAGLPSNVVWSTARDHQGRLWAATDGGLVVQEPNGWKVVAKGQFSRVRIHPDGTILAVGSPGGTLYTVDPSSLITLGHVVTCMRATEVSRGLAVEADGTVWISDYRQGFARGVRSDGQWHWVPGTLEGKPPKNLFEVVQDGSGSIYLPTAATVFLRSRGGWESLGETLPYTPLGAQRINDEEIWVAYLDRPVLTRHRKQGGTWRRVDEWWPFLDKNQLQILSLAATPEGALWVGTSQGLGCLDPGTRTRKAWVAPGEGIPGADATTQGLFLEPSGDLWFSTTSGLGLFHTAEQKPPALIPAPLLVGWAVKGKSLPLDGTRLSLEPRADLDAHFAIPCSLYPSTLGLEARLSGVDQDWVRLDGNHLRYGALAQGLYRLDVRLRREEDASGQITTLTFRVLPKWWETWWARTLYALFATGTVYGLVMLRSRALRKQNQRLQETVTAKTRELREANDDLTQANNLKSRFLATAAHDLKNPLTSILLHSELIQAEAEPDHPAISSWAQRLHTTGQTMLQIINGLLETAAQEARDVTLRLEESNIPDLVHQVVAANLEYAYSKHIKLSYQEMLAGECWGFLDETHFRQALDNLVNNAIKYSPQGTEVAITLTPHLIDGQTSVEIQVKDQGPGLTPEDMAQAFGVFQRLSAKPTGGEYSTGLGLSIVKQMVELHGGRVWIESELGHGASFCIEIPLRTGAHPVPERTLRQV